MFLKPYTKWKLDQINFDIRFIGLNYVANYNETVN